MMLHDAIATLRAARKAQEQREAYVVGCTVKVEALPEYKALQEATETWKLGKAAIAELEDEVRRMTIAEYEHTGNKKPAPGVGIRIKTVLEYDRLNAQAWVRANMPALMLIDTKAFEATVKNTPGLDAPVEIREEATATIAKNL